MLCTAICEGTMPHMHTHTRAHPLYRPRLKNPASPPPTAAASSPSPRPSHTPAHIWDPGFRGTRVSRRQDSPSHGVRRHRHRRDRGGTGETTSGRTSVCRRHLHRRDRRGRPGEATSRCTGTGLRQHPNRQLALTARCRKEDTVGRPHAHRRLPSAQQTRRKIPGRLQFRPAHETASLPRL